MSTTTIDWRPSLLPTVLPTGQRYSPGKKILLQSMLRIIPNRSWGSKVNIFQIQTSNLVFEWMLHIPIWSNGYKGSKVPGLLLFLHRHQRKQKGRRRNKCPLSKNPGSPLLRLLSATSHHPLLQWKCSVSASWIRSWRFKMCHSYFVKFMCTVLGWSLGFCTFYAITTVVPEHCNRTLVVFTIDVAVWLTLTKFICSPSQCNQMISVMKRLL